MAAVAEGGDMLAEFQAEAAALAAAFGIVTLVTFIIFLISLATARLQGQMLACSCRFPRCPWTAWEITGLFLAFLTLPAVMTEFLNLAGLPPQTRLKIEQHQPRISPEARAAAGGCLVAAEDLARDHQIRQLRQVWGMALSLLVIAGLGQLLRLRHQRPLFSEPLTCQVAIGALAWLPIVIVTFFVYLICLGVMALLDQPPDRHPFVQLSLPESDWPSWLMFGLLVCVLGPGLEEWLFRGLILPWSMQRSGRPLMILAMAVIFGTLSGNVWAAGWCLALMLAYPLLLKLAIAVRPRFPRRFAGGIYASATLFAAGHSLVWPSPIPLFVMGLLLGYLTARTGHITAAWFVHGLFNAITYVYLLRGGAAG
jgi:membrane protease YdiL (CAAX protease family)